MLLVTMPLSQRTRSEPVTRIQPRLGSGAKAAEVRRAFNPAVIPDAVSGAEVSISVHLIIAACGGGIWGWDGWGGQRSAVWF